MNIVFISKYLVLPQFGPATRQFFLAKHLSGIEGNKVILVGSRSSLCNIPSFEGLSLSERKGNLETIILNGPKINSGFSPRRIFSWLIFEKNVFRFRKNIKAHKPDVIIVSSLSILTFLSGIFLKKWLKIPLIVEVRDLYPLTLTEIGKFSAYNPLIIFLKWVEKEGYKNADYIISTLPNAKEHIGQVLKKPFKFAWFPMGIDEEYFETAREKPDSENLIRKNKNDFLIVYAGTLGRANALDIIFEAAKSLEDEYRHIKFFFIGDGPLKSFYMNKYASCKNVHFIAAVPKKDLQNYLSEADILVNSWLDKSIYRFGISPNKWIDYMYAAKPILVAYSGYKCIINEADCGVFTPAEDVESFKNAIIQFSNMLGEELKQIGENGRKYLNTHLSYQQLAGRLNDILISVVNKRNVT